jgi:glycosyltransferase involved in cell wall biosynthesis
MKLSIVVPSKNQGCYLESALESLVSQSDGDNLEVIVRDCLSDDETPAVLNRFAHQPCVTITSEQDQGQSDALMKGFAAATGDVFGWLNADDVLLPGAVDHVLATFASRPMDVLFGEALFIDEDGNVVRRYPTAGPRLERLRDRCVLSQPSVLFSRDAYEAVGGINPERHYCMDYELWTRFAKRGVGFVRTDRVLSATRLHAETKTANGGLAFIEEICDMQMEILGKCSPVWQVYRESRLPSLRNVKGKALRFAIAGWRVLSRQPSALHKLMIALGERSCAGLLARMRARRIDGFNASG